MPVQQSALLVQVAPSGWQTTGVWHTPRWKQEPPPTSTHAEVAHTPPAQRLLQQSAPCVHEAPAPAQKVDD